MNKRVLIIFSALIAVILVTIIVIKSINYFTAPKIEIHVDPNGYVYVEANIELKDLCLYWETDAGNIKPAVANSGLKIQSESAYYCYTDANEQAILGTKDYDGSEYSGFTLRVILYSYNMNVTKYYVDEIIASQETTVEYSDKTYRLSKEARIFGNPVRADGINNWSQIYSISDNASFTVLRYRTGNELGREDMICWKASTPPLTQPLFTARPYSPDINSCANTLNNNETACFYFDRYKYYQPLDVYFDSETKSTTIYIEAFVLDGKTKTENFKAETVYIYNKAKREHYERNK